MVNTKEIEDFRNEMKRLELQQQEENEAQRARLALAEQQRKEAVAKISSPLTPEGMPVLNVNDFNYGDTQNTIQIEEKKPESVRNTDTESTKKDSQAKPPGELDALSFGKAFASAAKDGLKTFPWRGTEYAVKFDDAPKKNSPNDGKQLQAAGDESAVETNRLARKAKDSPASDESSRKTKDSPASDESSSKSGFFSSEKLPFAVRAIEATVKSVNTKVAAFFRSDKEPESKDDAPKRNTSFAAKTEDRPSIYAGEDAWAKYRETQNAQKPTHEPTSSANNNSNPPKPKEGDSTKLAANTSKTEVAQNSPSTEGKRTLSPEEKDGWLQKIAVDMKKIPDTVRAALESSKTNPSSAGPTADKQSPKIQLPAEDQRQNDAAMEKARAEYSRASKAEQRKIEEITGLSPQALRQPSANLITPPAIERPELFSATKAPQAPFEKTGADWTTNKGPVTSVKSGGQALSVADDHKNGIQFSKLVYAVGQAESTGPANRNTVTSTAGAKGWMQVMPKTAMDPGYGSPSIFDVARAKEVPVFGKDRQEAERLLANESVNKEFGKQYLSAMIKHSGGDVIRALVGYNDGIGDVGKHIKQQKTFSELPKESQDYVAKVAAYYHNTTGESLFPGAGPDRAQNKLAAESQFNERYAHKEEKAPAIQVSSVEMPRTQIQEIREGAGGEPRQRQMEHGYSKGFG